MPIHLCGGDIDLNALGEDRTLTVIHGGAGPADPRGPRAQAALRSMIATADHLASLKRSDIPPFPRFLEGERAPRTYPEILSVTAARLLELDPVFNAGRGSAIQEDGRVRVSASFMESTRRKFSAVMNAPDVLHPSELAYYLQSRRFCVLDGAGSQDLARDLAVPRAELLTLERFDQWAARKRQSLEGAYATGGTGTIGCVSIDRELHLSAITSTGGVGNETVGRVGDTPTIAGNYCSSSCAVSCTGYGEQIIDVALAPRISLLVETGRPLDEAMRVALEEAESRRFELAAIAVAVDRASGRLNWAAGTTTSYFVWAAITPEKVIHFADASQTGADGRSCPT